MKTLVSALVLSAAFVGAAQAGELDWPPAADTASTVTRAQVRDELAQARAAGEIANGEQAYPAFAQSGQQQASRAQVRQDLRDARVAGALSNGEQSYPPVAG